jgi:hypothetical protein
MSTWSRWTGLFLVLALVVPVIAGGDAKEAKKDAKKADAEAKAKADKKGDDKAEPKGDDKAAVKPKVEPKERFVWGTELTGKLNVEGNSQKDITLHVSQKVMVPNVGAIQSALQRQAQWAQRQQQIMRNPNPYQRQRDLAQLMRDMAQGQQQNLYQVKDVNQDVKLRAAENIKIRLLTPPIDYDDKGNPKKYTPKELDELRGPDKSLPGYGAEFDSLRSGQMVKVYLAKNQNQPPKMAPGQKGKKKNDDEVAPADELGSARPEVVMILVIQEPWQPR